MNLPTAAAVVFALVTLGVVAFQVALAFGAPWGTYAMGGRFPGRYPPTMRIVALGQAVLLAALAVIVLSTTGLIMPAVRETLPSLIWLAVAFSAISVVLNVITPSTGERKVWVPVAVAMFVSSLVVAVGAA